MRGKNLIQMCAGMPVPLLPSILGAITLSSAYYQAFGFTWLRHMTTIAGMIIWLFMVIKIAVHFDVFKSEYKAPVPASVYAAFAILMMSFGAYLHPHWEGLGKGLWLSAIALHALHILVFTWRNVITSRSWETFIPTWFITYNGILVAPVLGEKMGEPFISGAIVFYGMAVYIILLAFMIYRLAAKPLNPLFIHSKTIVMAPAALCLVGYFNIAENINTTAVYLMYTVMLVFFLYFLKNLPAFLRVPFTPGFAGLTFPNAIALIASLRMSEFLQSAGNPVLSRIAWEIAGIQFVLTSALIAFVLYNYARMFAKSYAGKEAVPAG